MASCLLVVASGWVAAAPPAPADAGATADNVLRACLKRMSKNGATSTDGWAGVCYDDAAKSWNRELDRVVRELREELSSAELRSLEDSQQAWGSLHASDEALWRGVLARRQTPSYELTIMAQRRYMRVRTRALELRRLLDDARFRRG